MDRDKIEIQLTGNLFVDTGIAAISCLAKLDEPNHLTLGHLRSIHGDGSQLAEWNSRLKAFTQVFGTNNPLFQPGYGFRKGKGPSNTNRAIYKSTLTGLLAEIDRPETGPTCWACGQPSGFDFARVCNSAIEENGKRAKGGRSVGRDWFPLAGSLGSDAQALPAASQPPHICPRCLFALQYLPLGLISIEGRLAVFQSTSTEMWYELICDIVNEVRGRILSGEYDTLGVRDGSRALIRRLLALFERLQKEEHRPDTSGQAALYLWRFSNSGPSAECSMEMIPNPAIAFLWNAVQEGLRPDLEELLGFEKRNGPNSLCRCLLDGRDYSGLYPDRKKKGASLKLFALYQAQVCGHLSEALKKAHVVAMEASKEFGEKELERLRRPEGFEEGTVRSRLTPLMVRLSRSGEFVLEDYLDLFPVKDGPGVAVKWCGWDLIRFCLHHTDEEFPTLESPGTRPHLSQQKAQYYAAQIYDHHLAEKGESRFAGEILQEAERSLTASWLRSQFLQLAESEDGFTYGNWAVLCKMEDGRTFVAEPLFQMRLLWAQWLHEGRTSVDASAPATGEATDGLPERMGSLVEGLFSDYVDKRGLARFHRDILLRLRRKDLGLEWFKEKLTRPDSEDLQPLTEGEWEDFLLDEEGRAVRSERLFQLHLALANQYRLRRSVS